MFPPRSLLRRLGSRASCRSRSSAFAVFARSPQRLPRACDHPRGRPCLNRCWPPINAAEANADGMPTSSKTRSRQCSDRELHRCCHRRACPRLPIEPSPRYHQIGPESPWRFVDLESEQSRSERRARLAGETAGRDLGRMATSVTIPADWPGRSNPCGLSRRRNPGSNAYHRELPDITQFENSCSDLAMACAIRRSDGGRLPWSFVPYDAFGSG